MVSKATPIEQLPNVQMDMTRESMGGPPQPPMPPNGPNPMNNPNGHPQQPPGSANQMAEHIASQQQAEQMASQEQYRQRQFVPQYPPSHDPYSGQQMPPRPTQQFYDQQQQMEPYFDQLEDRALQDQVYRTQPIYQKPPEGILNGLMGDSKCLFMVFLLLIFVQLEGSQNVFRKLASMVRIPDTMIFTGAKVLLAIVVTVVFFFGKRSLC